MLLIGSETLSANPGKIEAFNGFCTTNFIAEVKASNIITLDQLNEAFLAWVDEEYNRRKHSELGMSPKQRWLKDSSRIEYLDEKKIRKMNPSDNASLSHTTSEAYRR